MLLEKEQDNLSTHRTLREQREATLQQVREKYRQMQDQLKTEREQSKTTYIVHVSRVICAVLCCVVLPCEACS